MRTNGKERACGSRLVVIYEVCEKFVIYEVCEKWRIGKMKKSNKKVCFICSSGGHFSEMSKLKGVAEKFDSFLVTERTENFETDFCGNVHYIREINRKERFFLFRFLAVCVKEFFIFLRECPDVVVTTGALCAYPLAKIAKMFRKKVVYVESYARVNDLSLTGKKMYKFADLFLVQWQELAEKYPKARFVGSVF